MAKRTRAYGIQRPLEDVFPVPIIAQRAPTTADKNYELGQLWIYQTTGVIYALADISSGSATWSLLGPGASDVDTLTGDSGGALSPTGGNITLSGGTNITTVGAGSTITFNLDAAIALATSVTSPIYTTSAADMNINSAANQDIILQMGDAAGAQKISFEDSGSVEVASLDSDGTLTVVEMDGIIGANTPAAGTFTTVTANTSVTSADYTGGAGTDLQITAPAGQDTIITLGDSAGANNFIVEALDGTDVFTVDSTGTIAFTNLSNTGTFTTAGGTASVNASSNFNTVINSGTSTGSITIGNGAAGAITADTAAGISLDGATASNFTVTGAADLTLASTAGSIPITAGEAASDAIVINASDGAGGVQVQAGTGGILVGNQADCTTIDVGDIAPTAARTITVGGGTVVTASVTDTIDIGPDGATTNADSVKTVNVNTGGVTTGQVLTNIASGAITSGTHTVSIQSGNAAAGTVATNISTGTGTKSVNVGNADANTTINLDGAANINDSINAATQINTGTSTGAITLGNSLAGAIITDSSANIEINSAGGQILIGDDDVDQNIEVGTDGERTVTVGSTNGAAALTLQSGTGEITVTGTVKEIGAEFLEASGDEITAITQNPILQAIANTGAAPVGTINVANIMYLQQGVAMESYNVSAQTIIAPRMDSNGLNIALDQAVGEGVEYNWGAGRTNSRHAFTIGTDAAFFFEVGLYINDMDGAAPYVLGFRKSEANNATFGNYTDYATIGMIAASSTTNIITATELNSGGQTVTDTTDAWGGDGSTNTLRVLVDASGNVTYTINGASPSSSAAFQFDNADVVCPFIRVGHSASATDVAITSLKVGYQA